MQIVKFIQPLFNTPQKEAGFICYQRWMLLASNLLIPNTSPSPGRPRRVSGTDSGQAVCR
jgi:hypothetical protein